MIFVRLLKVILGVILFIPFLWGAFLMIIGSILSMAIIDAYYWIITGKIKHVDYFSASDWYMGLPGKLFK